MLWCVVERGKAMSNVGAEDCRAYMDFLADVPDRWISRTRAGRLQPGWAPFKGSLSLASQGVALAALHSLFGWLVQARYLGANPWVLVNRKLGDDARLDDEDVTSRAFTPAAWSAMLERLATEGTTPSTARLRWLCAFVECTGLRAAELLKATVAHLRRSADGWTLRVHGKGRRNRSVPVPERAMQATRAYFEARGLRLDDAPSQAPLLASLVDPMAPIGYSALNETFTRFVRRAVGNSSLSKAEADRAIRGSTHWLRHTHATRSAERDVPPDVLQENMGQSDPRTTARYYRAQLQRRTGRRSGRSRWNAKQSAEHTESRTVATSHTWAFKARFRRNAFGWRGTQTAVERLNEAVGEIERAARVDPALGGEGAVLLLERLSPAVSMIDSSSGTLGSATAEVVKALVPLVVKAPVPRRVREKWLERLFEAVQEDDPPYIESLHEHWGALCGDADLASSWADRLLPLVANVMADRRKGMFAHAQAETLCYSALFHAGRLDELTRVLSLDPKPYWHHQQWAARARAARGDVDGAVELMEKLRGPHTPDWAVAMVAEQLLHGAGRTEEAYARYGIAATSANTHIATFRALSKRYPDVDPDRILGDLIASTPREEGKWFATAKTLKRLDLALALARRAQVDPKTLVRAARDHLKSQPAFSLEVALLALYWMARGAGYELTGADVNAARDHAVAAAEAGGLKSTVDERITESIAGEGRPAIWVRGCLGL